MSRSDPLKKKPREAKYTVYAYGEGETEKAFLNYLKTQYSRNTNLNIKVEEAGGYSPTHIVTSCVRRTQNKVFNRKFILLDSDKPIPDEIVSLAKKHSISLLLSSPYCIEGLFISILEPSFKGRGFKSAEYKDYFRKHYLNKSDCTDPACYGKVFTRSALDTAKNKLPVLNKLIDLLSKVPSSY